MPSKTRIRRIVRMFPQNAIQFLLEDMHNAADVLRVSPSPLTKQMVVRMMKRIPTTFVKRNFRHIKSDVLLSMPHGSAWARGGESSGSWFMSLLNISPIRTG